MRSSWKGTVSAGLLSVPVSMGSTTSDSGGPELHQYAPDGGRIKYKRVSEATGKEVQYSEIVMGYEANGVTVMLSDADFEEAYGPVSRNAGIRLFTDAANVPDDARDKAYAIRPAAGSERAYALLAATLKATGKVAITEFGIRARKHLAMISERDGYLYLTQLLWAEQVVRPDFDASAADFSDKELALATQMVEAMSGEFDHTGQHDDSAAKLNEMITARLEGKATPKQATSEPEKSPALDLMAVLTASVAEIKAKREAAKPADETTVASQVQADAPNPKTTTTRTRTSKPKTTTARPATGEQPAKPRTVKAATVKAVPAPTPTRRRTAAKVTATAA